MLKSELVDMLNGDLSREYAHWHFYMNAAICVSGLHREEYQEFFLKEASGEMQHIQEFGQVILGLDGIPITSPAAYVSNQNVIGHLLNSAMTMEREVVDHYAAQRSLIGRMLDEMPSDLQTRDATVADLQFVDIFLENQILDSRNAVDHIRQILRGF